MKRNKRPATATDDVRNQGGKDLILRKMVNHYKALADIKSVLNIQTPHPHVGKNRTNLNTSIYI